MTRIEYGGLTGKAATILFCFSLAAYLNPLVTAEGDRFFYDDKTFSIRSTITRFQGDSTTGTQFVREFYSATQSRAKLQYGNNEDREDLYFDVGTQSGSIFNLEHKRCRSADLATILETIFSGSKRMSSLVLELQKGHLVGTFGLLSHLSTRVGEMKPFTSDETTLVRNHEVVMLELKTKTRDNKEASIILFYDRSSFVDKESSCKILIPLRLGVTFTDTDEFITIDYSEYHQNTESVVVSGSSQAKTLNDLAMPLGYNCSSVLPKMPVFEKINKFNSRLSFRARTMTKDREHVHFVAFDWNSQAMRVDSKEVGKVMFGMEAVRASSKFFDFHTNRRYTVVDNPQLKYGTIHKLIEPKVMSLPDYKCTSTEAYLLEELRYIRGNGCLDKLLLGADKFAYMGRASVRGIEAKVYEADSEIVPFWFSQPAVVVDSIQRKFVFMGDYHPLGTKTEYITIVYTSLDGGRLLAMEIYDISVSEQPIISMQLYDFIWGLSDAPDGTKSYALFDPHDACLESPIDGHLSGNRYAEVEMNIVGNHLVGADWLSNMPERQLALSSELRFYLCDRFFLLYDLESKVHRNNSKTNDISSIRVSFRVIQHDGLYYNMTYLGKGSLQYNRNVKPVMTSAQSPADCFWLANQLEAKQRSFHVFYNGKSCMADPDPTLVSGYRLNNSQLFTMDESGRGEIYRLEWTSDDNFFNDNGRRFEAEVNKLILRTIDLYPQGKNVTKKLELDVDLVKVHNVGLARHLTKPNKDDDVILAAVYPGFAYTLDQTNRNLRKYNLPEALADRSMSVDQCETGCLADLSCKSFSFCTGWPQSSCILSRLALKRADLSSVLIDPELTKSTNRGDKFNLEVDGQQVELKVEPRCELRNKLYIRMFERGEPVKEPLDYQKAFKVDSEEQCAERCFKFTLDALDVSLEPGEDVDQYLGAEVIKMNLTEKVKGFRAGRIKMLRTFCADFMYLEGSLNDQQLEQLDSRLESSDNATGSAYCLINRFQPGGPEVTSVSFEFDLYKFDMSNLYERQQGIELKKWDKSKEEDIAWQTLFRKPSEKDIETLEKAYESGKNFKYTKRMTDPSDCAKLCLFQSAGLYPVCQSFDFRVTRNSYCSLNTRSLSSYSNDNATLGRKEEELITRSNILVHYEPRFQSVKRRIELNAKLWALSFDLEDSSFSNLANTSVVTVFLIVILTIAAVGTGIVIGSKSIRRLSAYRLWRARSAGFENSIVTDLDIDQI